MPDEDDHPDPLDEVENWRPGDPPLPVPFFSRLADWGRESVVGAAMAGWTRAMQDLFEANRDEQIVIEVDADGEPHDLPIRLFLDPDDPSGSLCVVRRDPAPPVV